MSQLTSRAKLYLPGGGSSGTNVPDEVADIDRLNENFRLIDAQLGAPVYAAITNLPATAFSGQLGYVTAESGLFVRRGSAWERAGAKEMPVGTLMLYAGTTAPPQWRLADGAALSRTSFAKLYATIGTRYGTGNGSSTFNVPNMKGRVPVGFDSGQTEFNALGKTGGSKTHTLTRAQLPKSRLRVYGGSTGSDGAGTDALRSSKGDYPQQTSVNYGPWFGGGFQGVDNVRTDELGSGSAHPILSPYMALNFIIKQE